MIIEGQRDKSNIKGRSTYIRSIIKRAYTEVNSNQEKFSSIGLRDGLLGLSLFRFYLGQFDNDPKLIDAGQELIEQIFTKLNDGYVSSDLQNELLELGWYLEFCKKNEWIDINTNEILDDIDAYLSDLLDVEISKRNFDPFTGIIGFAYYFMARINSEPSHLNQITKIIAFFNKTKVEKVKGQYFWYSRLNGKDEIYIGLSHGVAAIINFLSSLPSEKLNEKQRNIADDLIIGACNFLMNIRKTNSPFIFDTILGDDTKRKRYSKNYCYGDPGTLFGLLKGYTHLNHPKEVNYIIDQYKQSIALGYDTPYFVAGQSLLYGHAGLAMLVKKITENIKDELIISDYQFHIDQIINSFDPEAPFLGYKGYWNQSLEHTNYCYSEGLIGIGMELIDFLQNSNSPSHDIFFYLN